MMRAVAKGLTYGHRRGEERVTTLVFVSWVMLTPLHRRKRVKT